MLFVLPLSTLLRGLSVLDRRPRGLTVSLLARLPTVPGLLVPLVLRLRALVDLCVVACRRRQRHTMLPQAHTMLHHHSSHHSLFMLRRLLCTTSSNHRNPTAFRTPTTVPPRMLVAYLHHRRRRPQVWLDHRPKPPVRDHPSHMAVQQARHRKFDQLLSIALAPLGPVIKVHTIILIALLAAVSQVVPLLQHLPWPLPKLPHATAMIVLPLHLRSVTASGRTTITLTRSRLPMKRSAKSWRSLTAAGRLLHIQCHRHRSPVIARKSPQTLDGSTMVTILLRLRTTPLRCPQWVQHHLRLVCPKLLSRKGLSSTSLQRVTWMSMRTTMTMAKIPK
jgi:hypothetical protein